MQTRELDKLLTRLYLDPRLRSELRADRETFARRYCRSADQLAGIDLDQLEFFANSLVRKRANEVLKLLPLTSAAAGNRFHREFDRFAVTAIPAGYNKHAADALAFARHLIAGHHDQLLADAARFELARLEGRLKCIREPGEPQIVHARRRRLPRIRLARFSAALRSLLESGKQVEQGDRRITAIFIAIGAIDEIWYW